MDDLAMTMTRGPFDCVPLNTLFRLLAAADENLLRLTARTIDAARSADDSPAWEWAPHHAVFPGSQPWTNVILGMQVIKNAASGDGLEFHLDVEWTNDGQLAVAAAVDVACWCDTDHATHDVDALRLAVGEEASLPQAFAACAEQLLGWLNNPQDADYWRDRANLPPRQPHSV